ncbi:MAG: type IX secretion system membrane protein PorP/SprF [Chitinophagaceae bacterium]
MKKYCMLLMLVLPVVLAAQQKPHYSQYILNNYVLNPAISGIENYTDIKLSHRSQWQGIEGAPQTTYLTFHMPLGKSDYRTTATSYSMDGENPRGNAYWENYTSAAPHHGIGAVILRDRAGFLSRTTASLSYAYHIGISPQTSISAGFQAGISSISLDADKINWAALDPNDPAVGVNNGLIRKLNPELGAGIWLYSADYFLGASVLNLVPGKVSFAANEQQGDYYKPHFFITAGYRFLLSDDLNIIPSIMAKYIAPLPVQPELNVKLQYRDLGWIGGSYRLKDQLGGWAAMAGFNVNNIFNVGYAYELTTSGLQTYSRGTHELMIGFLIGNTYGDSCPRNVW